MSKVAASLYYLILGLSFCLWPACGGNATKATSTEQQVKMPVESVAFEDSIGAVTAQPFSTNDQLYAWVDALNIRDAPKQEGKVVTKVDNRAVLRFTGERSNTSETIVLRGVAYHEPWLKVLTADGTEGWVFGGAVKHEDEQKGNSPITDQVFSFPVFGTYNLAEWEKVSSKKEGEEVDFTIDTYRKGNQWLEITQADRGEFYYGWTYKLMDADTTVLKKRQFDFAAEENPFVLTETVEDHTSSPPKLYRRTQTLGVHYYQLNARPMMVAGPWQIDEL